MLRFIAGIEEVPDPPFQPFFFTLTFKASRSPDEDTAHRSLRSLVRRLRYRGLLGEYGWVLQRTKAGTLHYHGIAHMPWMDDDLHAWRRLIIASGFGIQNRLTRARIKHARYCSRYVSRSLAQLAPLRRAYAFSPGFPKTEWQKQRDREKELDELLSRFGIVDDESDRHEWEPARGILS